MASVKNRNNEPLTPRRQFVPEKVVAEVTHRSIKTLQKDRLLKTGPFPHYRISGQIRYDLNEVIAIVESTRVA